MESLFWRCLRNVQCSRQRGKSTQPPLANQATWGFISRRKTSLELSQIFRTLAERGRKRKRTWTHQLLPSLVLHASSNGQPASRVQSDTTVVLHVPNSELQLEREWGLNHLYLPQISSLYENLHFLLPSKLHKKGSHAQELVFVVLKISLLSFCLLILSSRSKVLHLPRAYLLNIRQKGEGRPYDLHLNSLWMSRRLSSLRASTWCMTQRLFGSALESMSPVQWAEMLTLSDDDSSC